MGKKGFIKIHRKGHWKDVKPGPGVKKKYIPPTDYWRKDTGAPGVTPKGKRWFEAERETGWRKTQEASTRRTKLLTATDKRMSLCDRYLQAARIIGALANVTANKSTEQKARSDANYFYAKHRKCS